ncbi:MAG: transposase [Phycisphaeraceae bacterium]|nr:transposase [Phycisphaeraceae bacterium]
MSREHGERSAAEGTARSSRSAAVGPRGEHAHVPGRIWAEAELGRGGEERGGAGGDRGESGGLPRDPWRAEGTKEDTESWRSFLRHLKERGLRGVRLVVSDKCLGGWSRALGVLPRVA